MYFIMWPNWSFLYSFLVGSLNFDNLYLEKIVVTKLFGHLVIYLSFSTSVNQLEQGDLY